MNARGKERKGKKKRKKKGERKKRKYKSYNTYNRPGMVWEWDRHEAEAGGGPLEVGAAEPPFLSLFDAVFHSCQVEKPSQKMGPRGRRGPEPQLAPQL